MNPEAWAAGAAVVSVLVSLLALVTTIYLHRSSESDRRLWEQDQIARRERFETVQREFQNKWQVEQDDDLRLWQQRAITPKLEVVLTHGMVIGTGLVPTSIRTIQIEARNTGSVPVYIKNRDQILLPENQVAEPPRRTSLESYFPNSCDLIILPGTSTVGQWTVQYLQEQMRKAGFRGSIEIRGAYTDMLSQRFESEPLLFTVEETEQPDR